MARAAELVERDPVRSVRADVVEGLDPAVRLAHDDEGLVAEVEAEAFEEEWHRTAREVFTEWPTQDPRFDVALDLTRYVLEGMAISFLVHKETERDRRVLAYLERKLRELRDGSP